MRAERGSSRRAPRGRPYEIEFDCEPQFGPMRDDCLIWRWGKTRLGYGSMRIDGRHVYAHRFFWEQTHGSIPEGMALDHMCERKSCCNESHLRPVPNPDNVRAYYERRRAQIG